MADYFDETSFMVSFDTPEHADAALTAIVPLLEALNDEDADEIDWPGTDGELSTLGVPLIERARDGDIWFTSEESFDASTTANIVRLLLAEPGAPDEVFFTWASTCSKPRSDAFGGGACLVRPGGFILTHTASMYGQLASDLKERLG